LRAFLASLRASAAAAALACLLLFLAGVAGTVVGDSWGLNEKPVVTT
jgi:hypothetical protein